MHDQRAILRYDGGYTDMELEDCRQWTVMADIEVNGSKVYGTSVIGAARLAELGVIDKKHGGPHAMQCTRRIRGAVGWDE